MANQETLHAALRALARKPTGEDGPLVLVDGDVRITVAVRSDTKSTTVRLTTPYDANARGDAHAAGGGYRVAPALQGIRPMQITLRPEDHGDRAGKEAGHNVEVQTGDPAFDHAVYVDSPTIDPALLGAVLNPEVRAAVLELIALRVDGVTLDDHFMAVEVVVNGPVLVNDDDRAVKLVTSFAKLARAVPRVTATGEKHAPAPWFGRIVLATLVAAIGVPAMPIFFLYVAQMFGGTNGVGLSHLVLKDGYGPPRLVGFVGAFLFGLLSVTIVRAFGVPALAGRSDSRSRIRYLHVVMFVLLAEVGFVVGSVAGYGLFFTY